MGLILQDQVCSLELAHKLLTLRVKQESYFVWLEPKKDSDNFNPVVKVWGSLSPFDTQANPYNLSSLVSAFTASELMKLLPDRVDTNKNHPFNFFRFIMERHLVVEGEVKHVFNINYASDTIKFSRELMEDEVQYHALFSPRLIKPSIYDENLANCASRVLIYLIENNLVSVEEINLRND